MNERLALDPLDGKKPRVNAISLEPYPSRYQVKLGESFHNARQIAHMLSSGLRKHPLTRQDLTRAQVRRVLRQLKKAGNENPPDLLPREPKVGRSRGARDAVNLFRGFLRLAQFASDLPPGTLEEQRQRLQTFVGSHLKMFGNQEFRFEFDDDDGVFRVFFVDKYRQRYEFVVYFEEMRMHHKEAPSYHPKYYIVDDEAFLYLGNHLRLTDTLYVFGIAAGGGFDGRIDFYRVLGGRVLYGFHRTSDYPKIAYTTVDSQTRADMRYIKTRFLDMGIQTVETIAI
jgi:hypothetical protein